MKGSFGTHFIKLDYKHNYQHHDLAVCNNNYCCKLLNYDVGLKLNAGH